MQISDALRNAALDAYETAIGPSAVLKIRTGSAPANLASADSGTALATLPLPSDWMAAASGGTKAKLGTWQDLSGDATGTAGHFRVYASDGTAAHMQGTVAITGTPGADMTLDSVNVTAGQVVTVTGFTLTAGGG